MRHTKGVLDHGEAIDRARLVLTDRTALEVATAYADQVVFPSRIVVERPGDAGGFPGWDDEVLLIAVENQGVCSWGLSLGGDHEGAIVVGGELADETGTACYCDSLQAYVAARRWDSKCLAKVPLLQAQAAPLDPVAISFLRDEFDELAPTRGWPGQVNLRFGRAVLRILLWSSDDQCDWWISGDVGAVKKLLPSLYQLSDLSSALRSNDSDGATVLAEHRSLL